MGNKEHGLYVSSSPSSAARKAVSKLCSTDKKRKVQFSIREITQGSKKKTYGPYLGSIEKLKEPIELKGRIIRYKPVAKLSGKTGKKKGGMGGEDEQGISINSNFFTGEVSVQNNPSNPQLSERETKKQEGFKRKERLRGEGLLRNIRKKEGREQQEKKRHQDILKQEKIAMVLEKINELFSKIKDEKKLFEMEISYKVNNRDKIILMTYANYEIYLVFNGEKYIAFTSNHDHKSIWLESDNIDDFFEKLKKRRDKRIVKKITNKEFKEYIKY
jgi:hypothetical protein